MRVQHMKGNKRRRNLYRGFARMTKQKKLNQGHILELFLWAYFPVLNFPFKITFKVKVDQA